MKLKGSLMGLSNFSVSLTLKEFVPRTGVMMLPKVQGPGETTAWKCLRHTRKKVLQCGAQGLPLASDPWLLTNSCSSSWKTPEPATPCTKGRHTQKNPNHTLPGLRHASWRPSPALRSANPFHVFA